MYIYNILSLQIYIYIYIIYICTTNLLGQLTWPTYLANLTNSGTTLHLAAEKLGTRPQLAKCWLSEWPQSTDVLQKGYGDSLGGAPIAGWSTIWL